MLSTRSSFLRGLGRGAGACESPQALSLLSALFAWSEGANTKRLAGVIFLNCSSGFGAAFLAGAGVWTLRKLECGFGFDLEDGLETRKRCGEGVCVDIVVGTFVCVR
jgi:hypothetical protein